MSRGNTKKKKKIKESINENDAVSFLYTPGGAYFKIGLCDMTIYISCDNKKICRVILCSIVYFVVSQIALFTAIFFVIWTWGRANVTQNGVIQNMRRTQTSQDKTRSSYLKDVFCILYINILYFVSCLIENLNKIKKIKEKNNQIWINYLLFVEYIIQNVLRNRPFHVVILYKLFIHWIYLYRDMRFLSYCTASLENCFCLLSFWCCSARWRQYMSFCCPSSSSGAAADRTAASEDSDQGCNQWG